MIEKGKISSLQLGIMFYPMIIATAVLSIPSITALYAKNDLWLSPIWGSFVGFFIVYISCQLHKLFPKQTVIQYSEQILGKVFGKALGLLLIANLFYLNGVTARQYTELSIGAFLPHTPMSVITIGLVVVCGFAVRGGIEVVGRAAQIFFPLYLVSLVFIIVLLIPEYEVKNVFPVMENGLMPSIKGAAVSQLMFTLFFYIAFLLPYIKDEEKAMKWSMISVSFVMMTLVIVNLTILFVFGGTVGNYVYPVLSAAKYISIADFLEHIESIVVAVWVAGTFIKLSVQYYITVLATAQLFGLSDSRPIVFPVGLIIVLLSFWGLPNFQILSTMLRATTPFYALFINVFIPIMLLLIALFKNRKKATKRLAN
ncbi:endospore germination permease [Bacillus sp. B15-48]|uniref:GerAB/ArcD/ProY family transporter n=1 Tax=Bacillus sp. B15-48 TaxID=1548601 RepID=UPI00193F32CA|nr:endospore germination permease [Bacillus sp. B15-48]MBM4761098.1 endospore germination permease [Bacillus sp. B15-48]